MIKWVKGQSSGLQRQMNPKLGADFVGAESENIRLSSSNGPTSINV